MHVKFDQCCDKQQCSDQDQSHSIDSSDLEGEGNDQEESQEF